MSNEPISTTWDLGRDRYGRRVTMTRTEHCFEIQSHPDSQRDDGEHIRSLTRDVLVRAGEIAAGFRS